MILSLRNCFGDSQADSQQDSNIALMAIADGVGGGPAGEVASRCSVESFCKRFIGSVMTNSNTQEKQNLNDLIRESFCFAHGEVGRLGVQNPNHVGMAST